MSGDPQDLSSLFSDNDLTAPSADSRLVFDAGSLRCEGGGHLEKVEVAYETWGQLNADRSNAILVCHALSGDSHCIGWWSKLIGPGKAIDTNRYFVIGTNALGGCQGTTGPSSTAPDGKPYGSRFPFVTVGDMVEVQGRLVQHLGIDRLLSVCGGSMGGMQALEWTCRFPDRVATAFITASAAAHSAMQIGFNEAARQAVMRDPAWKGGNYEPPGPVSGLTVARMIGHLTFLSEGSFAAKFGRALQDRTELSHTLGVDFEIESYLKHQGEKFTTRFDANSLLLLTKAIDYYSRADLHPSQAEYLFVSYTSDWIYPPHQAEQLHELARAAGCRSRHVTIDLPFGHDSFLLDGELQGAALKELLARR